MPTTADTSRAAYAIKRSTAHADRLRIADFIRSRGIDGSTCDEAEEALGMSHQTCSARFSEMSKVQTLVPSGELRKTRTGCKAMVYLVHP